MRLAIETSTDICSVAFEKKSDGIFEKRTEERGSHSELLFLFIKELMKEHNFSIEDLDEVLVSEGPGSYTGLRIGASAVKGLLFQSSVKLFAVNTLSSFAAAAVHSNENVEKIHSVIDARRVHLYHQEFTYRDSCLSSNDRVKVIPIDRFEKLLHSGDVVIGTGLDRIEEKVLKQTITCGVENISAISLLKLPEVDPRRELIREVDPKQYDPRYYTSNQG